MEYAIGTEVIVGITAPKEKDSYLGKAKVVGYDEGDYVLRLEDKTEYYNMYVHLPASNILSLYDANPSADMATFTLDEAVAIEVVDYFAENYPASMGDGTLSELYGVVATAVSTYFDMYEEAAAMIDDGFTIAIVEFDDGEDGIERYFSSN